MNAWQSLRRVVVFVAVGASSAGAQGKSPAKQVTFTSACACPTCHGKHRWDAKTDRAPAPASVPADHRLIPSQVRHWAGPGGDVGKNSPRTGKELEFFELTGEIRWVRAEDDGDIHVQLADQGKGANAKTASVEIPAGEPWCAIRAQLFALTSTTFPLKFSKHVDLPPRPGTVITVTGKPFYDVENDGGDAGANDRSGAKQSRTTVWEIHPVMKLVVAGK